MFVLLEIWLFSSMKRLFRPTTFIPSRRDPTITLWTAPRIQFNERKTGEFVELNNMCCSFQFSMLAL